MVPLVYVVRFDRVLTVVDLCSTTDTVDVCRFVVGVSGPESSTRCPV